MKLLRLIFLFSILATPHMAMAQVKIIPGAAPKQHELLDESAPLPKNMSSLANIYYAKCVNENKDPALAEYIQIQCGCTASRVPIVMSIQEMQAFLDPAIQDDYYYSRLMTLAYVPCLENSVGAFVYDDCLTSSLSRRVRTSLRAKTCQCIADNVGERLPRYAISAMPGTKGSDEGFDLKQALMNPIKNIIGSEMFGNLMKYPTEACFLERLNDK
jgi:hypothetical protein